MELKQILEDEWKLKLTLQEVMEIGTGLLAYVETLLKIDSVGIYKGGKQNADDK